MLHTADRCDDFRIGFPVLERPRLDTLSGTLDVHDASADCLRARDPRRRLAVGRVVSACLRFSGGRRYGVRAKVVRRDGRFAVLEVQEGLSADAMRREQHRLVQRYRG